MQTWIIAESSQNTVAINATKSTEQEVRDFLDQHERRKIKYIRRPDGQHWDGNK